MYPDHDDNKVWFLLCLVTNDQLFTCGWIDSTLYWLDVPWLDVPRLDLTWLDLTWRASSQLDLTWRASTWRASPGLYLAGLVLPRLASTWHASSRPDMPCLDLTCLDVYQIRKKDEWLGFLLGIFQILKNRDQDEQYIPIKTLPLLHSHTHTHTHTHNHRVLRISKKNQH